MVYGALISMVVGFLVVLFGTEAGAAIGLISGYFMVKLDALAYMASSFSRFFQSIASFSS